MINPPNNQDVPAQEHQGLLFDEEPDVDENTRLLRGEEVDGTNTDGQQADEAGSPARRSWPGLPKWTKRDVGRTLLFAVPLLLFVPSLVFFVTTLNLRASLPPSSTIDLIANLTRRVSTLEDSLDTCTSRSARLATSLHEAEQRIEVCRENERRLAARIDVVEELLGKCQDDEAVLKEQLGEVKGDLNACSKEKEELKRQMESGVFVQFLDLVGKMGTGGDSWVCSDATLSWSHGYTTTDSPHPTVTVEAWSTDLDDVQHSAIPLVFPPTSLWSKSGLAAEEPMTSLRGRLGLKQQLSGDGASDKREASSNLPLRESIRIVGYTVNSLNTSGNNGWWRINNLPAFATEGATLEFFAQAAKWYGSTARFKVTVYWLSI